MAEATTQGLTRRIARFVSQTREAAIPPPIFEHAKVALLDWYAVAVAGKDDPLVLKLIHLAEAMGGAEQATLVGRGIKKTALQAALINGAASHALDYDDTLVSFLGHPSVTLFPSLLALGEWRAKTGRQLLSAYLIGLKVGAVLGAFAGLSHYVAGWHGTSTIGHLASAAGCAHLLGLGEQQTVYALGIAATQASGLKRVFGTMCKPFHAGRASQAGLTAALLASEDFTSPEDILEGPQGFFDVLKGDRNEQALETLGRTWDIEDLAQKFHASCHATHSPIEGVWRILKEHGLTPNKVRSIRIRSSRAALSAAHQADPTTGLAAKFSIPYCVANAVLREDTGMQAFTDARVQDPEVRSFMKRISVVLDEEMTAMEAKVEVETSSGDHYTVFCDVLQEVPSVEVKRERIRAKFEDLCSPVLGKRRTEAVRETILSLDEQPCLEALFA